MTFRQETLTFGPHKPTTKYSVQKKIIYLWQGNVLFLEKSLIKIKF